MLCYNKEDVTKRQNIILIIFAVLILVLLVVAMVLKGSQPPTEEERTLERLEEITVPSKGDISVDVGSSDYEDVAIPDEQGPAISANQLRQAQTRIFDATISNDELSPATFIIQEEDSVRFQVRSTDGRAYDFTINRYAQSRPVPADGTEAKIGFSAYIVGEFPITCEVCGGTQIGLFVVTPKQKQ